jgi:hypothetical protein
VERHNGRDPGLHASQKADMPEVGMHQAKCILRKQLPHVAESPVIRSQTEVSGKDENSYIDSSPPQKFDRPYEKDAGTGILIARPVIGSDQHSHSGISITEVAREQRQAGMLPTAIVFVRLNRQRALGSAFCSGKCWNGEAAPVAALTMARI